MGLNYYVQKGKVGSRTEIKCILPFYSPIVAETSHMAIPNSKGKVNFNQMSQEEKNQIIWNYYQKKKIIIIRKKMMTSFLVHMYEYMILCSPLNSIYKICRDRQTDAQVDREEDQNYLPPSIVLRCAVALSGAMPSLVVSLSGAPGFLTTLC